MLPSVQLQLPWLAGPGAASALSSLPRSLLAGFAALSCWTAPSQEAWSGANETLGQVEKMVAVLRSLEQVWRLPRVDLSWLAEMQQKIRGRFVGGLREAPAVPVWRL